MPTAASRKNTEVDRTEIATSCPGTVVADFETLMDFVAGGVAAAGKFHLLPMARLNELDELMSTPLRPKMQRPQQRSFPHINGLYLLLRATRIGVPDGHGASSAKLSLDPLMCEQWAQLNSTEKYCNLLEAWLRISVWESVGSSGSGWFGSPALMARDIWQSVPRKGCRFSKKEQADRGFLYSVERAATLALLELFGLMTLERGEQLEGKGWIVAEIDHTRFGDEVLTIIFEEIQRTLFEREDSDLDFGVWQSKLQSFFPEWRNNLKFPEPEYRDGIYYFKVSLGRPWRRIAIAADSTLDELAECIISAFDFDGDHIYEFRLPQPDGTILTVAHPYIRDADLNTDEFEIGYLPIREGESIPFFYDFRADWQFTVKLEKITPPNPKITHPKVTASQGKAPKEYEDRW